MSAERSLTVAIFGESYLPYLSGVTVATEALARGLEAAGHRIVLAVPQPAASAQPTGDEAGGTDLEMAWLPSYQGPPPAPPDYRMPWPVPSAALARVRSLDPDIVHAQSPFVSGLMARRAARAVGAPLVFTHHTRFGDYRHYLGPLAGPGSALMEAYLGAYRAGCAAVVAPADDLAAEIEAEIAARGGRRRPIVRAIPTGIDLAGLQGLTAIDPRPLAGWPADATVAVSVGRLAREKSTDLLLDAFAGAARGDPRLRLLLVGDGPLRPEIERQVASEDLGERVLLTGRLPRLEALAMAAGADEFVFASRTETQGLVLAEALAVGLPVVTLDGPGVRSSVRDGVDGVVVARRAGRSAADLAEALRSLAADPDRRATMARAARDGAGRFAVASRIEEMVELYRSLHPRPR
jgi:1,2-diacylglycerol 3-alpha-glucosyltransferase